MKIRVRYAPSPTGYLHIGGARSALFNYLFAKKFDGDFVFRIEDTDFERNIIGAEESQLHDLIWLGIIPDESTEKMNPKYAPYRQSEKLDLYMEYAKKLIDMGYAYECFCTSEELEEMKEEQLSRGVKSFRYNRHCLNLTPEERQKYIDEGRKPSIRLKMPKGHILKFNDLVRGEMEFNSSEIGDFVIMKSNGVPTYNFAVVIDDHIMEITHVLRGEEHLSNTPKQLQIYEYFGWEPPKFGHMTIILNENGRKLSKRDHNILQFMSQYRELGYLPEAIFNFLYTLGYTDDLGKEIISKKEAIENFDPSRLSNSPAMFDAKKLNWVNHEYIKALDEDRYFDFIKPFVLKIDSLKDKSDSELKEISLIFKQEIEYGEEIVKLLNEIFVKNEELSEEENLLLNSPNSIKVIDIFKRDLASLDVINKDTIKTIFDTIKQETGLKGKDIYMPVRLKLTGLSHGIEMYNIVNILGKEETLKRL